MAGDLFVNGLAGFGGEGVAGVAALYDGAAGGDYFCRIRLYRPCHFSLGGRLGREVGMSFWSFGLSALLVL